MKLHYIFIISLILPNYSFSMNDDEFSSDKNRTKRHDIYDSIYDKGMTVCRTIGGTMVGSSIVHVGDTYGTLKLTGMSLSPNDMARAYLRSFKPIGLYIAPARGASIGLYKVMNDYFTPEYGDAVGLAASSLLSTLFLTSLTVPAEVAKTRKQIGSTSQNYSFFYEYQKNFFPLGARVLPTHLSVLVGTEMLWRINPFNNQHLAIFSSAFAAAHIGQFIATPAENARVWRINNKAYNISFVDVLKIMIKEKKFYSGYWARGSSVGIQGAFAFSAAYLYGRNNENR